MTDGHSDTTEEESPPDTFSVKLGQSASGYHCEEKSQKEERNDVLKVIEVYSENSVEHCQENRYICQM